MYWMEKESITSEQPVSKEICTDTIPQKNGIWKVREIHKAIMQP